ncbi:MAG: Omp28-related outer membrane protein [Bacteroidaceae bacterium]|nr:Omp28-related outer membrane protein [Bacteroidaceae bacterium]
MKKVLFLAVACMLSIGIHAQQFVVKANEGIAAQKSAKAANFQQQSVKSHRALAENQYYLGLYNTDDLAEYGSGMGSYASGECKAATEFGPEYYHNFAGFKVIGMRVGLCANTSNFGVFISKISNNSIVDFKSKSVGTGVTGWNTVMFDEEDQFQLPSDNTTFVIGFDYYQKSGSATSDCYPISYYTESANKGTFLFYGNIPSTYGGKGLGWYAVGTGGALSVQLIIEGELPDQHLILNVGDVSKMYYPKGGQVEWTIPATNMGKNEITSLGFDVQLDGAKLDDYTVNTSIKGLQDADIKLKLNLPTGIAAGSHTLKAELTTINGEAPTSDVENAMQTTTVKVYETSAQRQKMLIEHFTSWTCTYCHLGYKLLRQMEQQYNDVAWVAIHGNQSTQTDPYFFSTVDDIMSMLGSDGFPSASFNRTYLPERAETPDEIVYSIGYNEQYISQIVPELHEMMQQNAVPAFVTLAIEQSYNSDTRKLDITVKGTGVEHAAEFLDDNRVTIYLTEEGLKSRQYSNGRWESSFDHNNTLRAVLTNYQGDAITWNGDNFEMTKSYTIPANYVAENLSITAFVAPKQEKKQKMAVNNCERVKVATSSTAIETVNATDDTEVARYTLDGRRVNNGQKGLNIVRMANGKTVKVINK